MKGEMGIAYCPTCGLPDSVGDCNHEGPIYLRHVHTGNLYRLSPMLNHRYMDVEVKDTGRWEHFVSARRDGDGHKGWAHWSSDRYEIVGGQ